MAVNSKTLFGLSAMIAGMTPALGVPLQSGPEHIDSSKDIIVTGKRRASEKTITQTRAISNPQGGQLARFEKPVCQMVIGLPKAHAEIVEMRIREVADLSGVRTEKPGCSPNLTVIVAGDGIALVEQMHRKRPILFDSLALHDINRLLQSRGPSWTWQSTSPRRRDGGPVQRIEQIQFNDKPSGEPVSRDAYIVNNAELSRLSMPVRQDTDLAFVVLDGKAVVGHTLRQVADYAAMVGLAAIRTDKSDSLPEPSILTLFQDAARSRAAQPQVTSFDLAYLTSLYSGEAGFSSDRKTQAMAIQIDRRMKP